MQLSTVTQKGQITIPINLRQQLDLKAGDKVAFYVQNHKIILVKQKNDISTSFGILHINKKISLEDIEQAINQNHFLQ